MSFKVTTLIGCFFYVIDYFQKSWYADIRRFITKIQNGESTCCQAIQTNSLGSELLLEL